MTDTQSFAFRALRQWLAENGLRIVPICCTAAMYEATVGYRAEMFRQGKQINPEDMWSLMIAAAPDALKGKDND